MQEIQSFASDQIGAYSALFDELFPICRSISGHGLRQSLETFKRYMPLDIESTPSGKQVFDWTVPLEWEIEAATLLGPDGQVICDLATSNLHVVNYSIPVDEIISLNELRPHLHGIPDAPDLVPYVTSYYRDDWGFCLSQRVIDALPDGEYHARIVSRKFEGVVNYGTTLLTGESTTEILLSSYLCHPSMANNELAGPLVLLGLHDRISRWPRRRYSYRFALVPETIGSICFLERHGEHLREFVTAGLVLTCLGGPNKQLSYKTSRRTDSTLDRLMGALSLSPDASFSIREFTPVGGSDERQYCSPGFNLPIGQMARTIYGQYPEYHTSGDTKEFMTIEAIVRSVDAIEEVLKLHEYSGKFENTAPFGEPQLGKRGLYPNRNSPTEWGLSSDSLVDGRTLLERVLFVLNYSDGEHDMLEIADRAGCTLQDLVSVVDKLEAANLLKMRDV